VEKLPHFIFVCNKYSQIRETWLEKIVFPEYFDGLLDTDQLG
jgi:hypothetical protein